MWPSSYLSMISIRMTEWSKTSKKSNSLWQVQVRILALPKNPDPSNSLTPRFNPYPIFMTRYNDVTNIRRLYMSRGSNTAQKHHKKLFWLRIHWVKLVCFCFDLHRNFLPCSKIPAKNLREEINSGVESFGYLTDLTVHSLNITE